MHARWNWPPGPWRPARLWPASISIAGEVLEDACEKALFATPEATAAAVSYIAAQLSLLASAGDHARRAVPNSAMSQLRRAIEADPFGVVAHVLAVRDGCTPAHCGLFALLQDPSRVSANIAARVFEARLKSYAAAWPASSRRPVASNAPPAAAPQPAAAPGPRVPNNLYFPSASSIPPVNIMTAEPAAPPPHDTTGAAETPGSPRKPTSAAPAGATAPKFRRGTCAFPADLPGARAIDEPLLRIRLAHA